MNLDKSIEIKGFFWFENDEENKFPANLKVERNGAVTLDCFSQLTPNLMDLSLRDETTFFDLIGVSEKGYITLKDCYMFQTKLELIQDFINFQIKTHIAIIGVGYSSHETVKFDKVQLSFSNLNNWLNDNSISTSFEMQNDKVKSYTLNYEPRKQFEFCLNEKFKCSFVYHMKPYQDTNKSNFGFHINTYISIQTEKLTDIEEFRRIIYQLNQFFIFVTDSECYLTSFTGFSEELKQNSSKVKHEIYFEAINSSDKDIAFQKPNKMIVDFSFLKQFNFEKIINQWCDSYEIIQPSFALYFAVQMGAFRFLDSKFLSLIQGLEAFQKRTFGCFLELNQENSQNNYPFFELIEPDDLVWIQKCFSSQNKINLRDRLKLLIVPFQKYFGSKEGIKLFIDDLINTRNYLTHYSLDKKDSSKTGSDLSSLIKKLEVLFSLHFLLEIGLNLNQIDDLLTINHTLRQKMQYF